MVMLRARGVALCLAGIGAAFIIPSLWERAAYPIRSADLDVTFKHLASIPLSEIQRTGRITISLRIPNDLVHDRIRRAWGDGGYLLTALKGTNQSVLCFDKLGLGVDGAIDVSPVHFRPANSPPYGYSAECQSFGLSFRAPPGAMVTLRIAVEADRKLPSGDLIVAPYWTSEVKDRLVGLDLAEKLHPALVALEICGFVLLLLAAALFVASITPRGRLAAG